MSGKMFLWWWFGSDKGHRSGVRHAKAEKAYESVQNIRQTYHKSLKTSVSVHTERSRGCDVQFRAFAGNEIKYGAIKRVMRLSLNNCRRRGSSVRKKKVSTDSRYRLYWQSVRNVPLAIQTQEKRVSDEQFGLRSGAAQECFTAYYKPDLGQYCPVRALGTTIKEDATWNDQCLNGRIILKWVFKKQDTIMWTSDGILSTLMSSHGI